MWNKIFLRLLLLIILAGYIIAAVIDPNAYWNPPAHNMRPADWMIFISIFLFFLSYFIFWGMIFRNWWKNQFITQKTRRIWFWVILVGGFVYLVGPIVYYIVVVEMGKGLTYSQS